MAKVGDQVSVTSKAGPRLGVVTAVSGSLVRVAWDVGGETSIIPGPGTLSVVGKPRGKSAGTGGAAKKSPSESSSKKTARRGR